MGLVLYMQNLNVYMIVPFKVFLYYLVAPIPLCRPDLGSAGSGELLRVCASQSARA